VNDAGAEGLETGELERYLIAFVAEQPFSAAHDDRADQQVELVRQALAQQALAQQALAQQPPDDGGAAETRTFFPRCSFSLVSCPAGLPLIRTGRSAGWPTQ
jgi:hypothetical protein